MKTPRLVPLLGAFLLLLAAAGCGNIRDTETATEGPGPMNTALRLDLSGTSPGQTVLQNVRAIPTLSTLAMDLERAGLDDTLSGPDPITLFAPTNEAFDLADMEPEDLDAGDTAHLRDVLLYHIAEGEMEAGQLNDGATLVMMDGAEAAVSIDTDDASLNIDDADILYSDIESTNGVIHIVNLVLQPTPGGTVDTD